MPRQRPQAAAAVRHMAEAGAAGLAATAGRPADARPEGRGRSQAARGGGAGSAVRAAPEERRGRSGGGGPSGRPSGEQGRGSRPKGHGSPQHRPKTASRLPGAGDGRPKASIGDALQTMRGIGSDATVKQRPARPCCRLLKVLSVVVFLAGYAVLVAFLSFEFVKQKANVKRVENPGPACANVICPMDTVCQTEGDSALPHCSANVSKNVQTMEILLGITVGFPLAVCVPCCAFYTLHTYLPRFQAWRFGRRQLQGAAAAGGPPSWLQPGGTVGGAQGAAVIGALAGLLGRRQPPSAIGGKGDGGAVSSNAGHGENGSRPSYELVGATDPSGLDELFAPMARKKGGTDRGAAAAAADDDDEVLDSLFAPAKKGKPGVHRQPLGEAALCDIDVGLDLSSNGRGEGDELAELFAPAKSKARPRAPAPPRAPPRPAVVPATPARGRAATSEVSAGLSALFASPGARPHQRGAWSGGEAAGHHEEDEACTDAGQPDFYGYARRLARRAPQGAEDPDDGYWGAYEGEEDELSDAADSLAEVPAAEHAELFHRPLPREARADNGL